jgi:hypothetical protein
MDESLDRRREAVGVGREKREEKEERRGDAIEIIRVGAGEKGEERV